MLKIVIDWKSKYPKKEKHPGQIEIMIKASGSRLPNGKNWSTQLCDV